MNERQEQLLKLIVNEYIATAEPISSGFLVKKYQLGVSPATVRNDMAHLEEQGFLRQPHTSAGRVPTEKGYRFYLQNQLEPAKRRPQPEEVLRRAIAQAVDSRQRMRQLAKTLAELSGETAIVSYGPRQGYYTGLANLFAKPDFQDLQLVHALSEMFDQFEDIVSALYGRVQEQPQVFMGKENPFGRNVSAVLVRVQTPKTEGMVGLVGPMRMNYRRNIHLVRLAHDLLENG